MDLPVVLRPQVAERRGYAAFGHHRVRLPQKAPANERSTRPGIVGGDSSSKSGSPGANYDDVVGEVFVCFFV